MGAAANIRQADIRRAVRGVLDASRGSGKTPRIEIEGSRIVITLVDGAGPMSEADDIARRMREAFGE
jgi:hypothetical protein